jgi:CheY-like chemotaxis protein/HPt (histidine-containing phosphotransfer) domain-containing protein
MSHEIRTPLNGVIGNLELLAQTRLGDDQEELLHDADRAAKSLLGLIGNILDFSKIEAGKLSIERVEMNPAAIVREAVNIIQSRARQNGIFVTSSVVADVPEIVVGDPARLRQILLNLIGNAVKFTAAGGIHLRVTVDRQGAGSDQLMFAVHDSGKGFYNTKAASLFEAFTQDYKLSAENFEGTGLGLSICKSLVETMGGKIGCEGVPGEGASFFFTLPAPTIAVASATTPPDLSGRYVLLINVARDEEPEELLTYFTARRAIVRTTRVQQAAAIAENLRAQDKSVDLAIYVPKSDEPPPSGLVAALRKQRTVTMVYSRDSSAAAWRRSLKAGAAYLLARDLVPACLDQNIFDITGLGGRGRQRVTPDQLPNRTGRVNLEGKRILVLEDRVVNQTIITKQLRNFGIVPTIAGNGLLGLKKIEEGSYDLIFCDCSMPEMDGYAFTRTLRKREASSGSARTPVIAMTANAFREDMEKCIAAGMDDFLSKPVTLDRLGAVLAKWLGGERDEIDHRSSSDGGSDVIDMTVLRDLLGTDDRATMNEILNAFVVAANESWNEIQANAAAIDGLSLSRLAHGAKGEARNAGAVKLGELYAELEQVSKLGDRENIAKVLTQIPGEVDRVERFIAKYVEGEQL